MRIRSSALLLLLLIWPSYSKSLDIAPIPLEDDFLDSIIGETVVAARTADKTTTPDFEAAGKLGTPPIPEKIRDALPIEGTFDDLLPLKACTEDGLVPEDYVAPYTSEEMCDEYFEANFGSVDAALRAYQPDVVLIVGGSVGIGRANACYWAARGKKVISLATRPVHLVGKSEPTKIECEFASSIKNYQYDITKPELQRPLWSILKENKVETIDLLLLNAGRAILGDLREFHARDLAGAYMNNVFGLHEVWLQARDFLNPDLAVVFGLSSRLAESRFTAKSDVYSFTKRAVYDLLLAYAQQEEFVQPNTHYAAIVQGGAASSIGLNYYAPKISNPQCIPEYTALGLFANTLFNIGGLDINELARKFHKAYARIAAAADLNPKDRADIPQSFGWVPPGLWGQIEEIWYNSRILFPEDVSVCYGESWDSATEFIMDGCPNEDTGQMSCPLVGELFVPFIDPREPFLCSINA